MASTSVRRLDVKLDSQDSLSIVPARMAAEIRNGLTLRLIVQDGGFWTLVCAGELNSHYLKPRIANLTVVFFIYYYSSFWGNDYYSGLGAKNTDSL